MQSHVNRLPPHFEAWTSHLLGEMEGVVGYLAPNEMRFLALMAACPTATGEILEIGSFKGKSTIILAKAAALASESSIVNAVDPMTAPCETDPSLGTATSSLEDFKHNISEHGVEDRVRLHQMFSDDLATDWNTPLRLLWIDGDHTYAGTQKDFRGFAPHLADGAIVAIHDTLHQFEGGARVFMEEVLMSPNFGACGFCGSIAWAQFHADASKADGHAEHKRALARKLARLLPFLARHDLGFLEKKRYKLHRWMIPHGPVDPQAWTESVN